MSKLNIKDYYSPMRINNEDNTVKLEVEEWNYILYFLDFCSKQNNILIQKKAKDFLEHIKNDVKRLENFK